MKENLPTDIECLNESTIDELVDQLVELEEYLYDWASICTGEYGYVDHSKWTTTCMVLLQKYKFDINKIKEDILNGTILIHRYKQTNPKLIALEKDLYKKHKEKVEEFEKKHFS